MSEIDAGIIQKTKESLEKYINKPPLTEKLLSRPPFRFLHDIVTSVINKTGFMKGLFTDLEMNSENVKEKGAKINFLKKLIGFVSLVLNTPVNVNPSSIVAGKEAENTNILLQSLAKALSMKVDNDTFVKKTLAGEADKLTLAKSGNASSESKGNAKPKPESEKPKTTEKTKHRQTSENITNDTKKTSDVRKSKEKTSSEDKINDKGIEEKSKDKILAEEKQIRRQRKEKTESQTVVDKEKKEEVKLTKNKPEKRISHAINEADGDNNVKPPLPDSVHETKVEDSLPISDNDIESSKRMARPSSAKGTRHRHENDHPVLSDDKENDKKKTMVRPPSARPAPPKVRRSSEAGLDDTMNNQTKVSGLIIDVDRDSDDDGYVVEEYVGGGEIDVKFSHTNTDTLEDDEKHGSLVKSIMQSKKEFINNDKVDTVSHSDVQRKRERLSTEKEIEKIRQNLQAVTKSVNPLGKLIDFIQEDLDTMQKESERWHDENEELEKSLQAEQSVTNKLLKPLNVKREEQNKIRIDQEEAVAKLKANIEKNSKKIETMLLNSCSGHA